MDSSKELAASEKERKPAGEESEEPSSEFPSTSSGMSTPSGEKRRRLETEISRLKKEMRFMKRPLMLDVPALLLTTLEELTEEQLKTFQSHLTSGQLFGFPPIPERQLENTDRQDTVDHMVKRYGPERAVEITLWILREMKLDDLAENLQRDYTRGIPTASYKSSFQLRPKSSFDDALLSSSFLSLDSSQTLSLTSAGSSGQLSSQRPFMLDVPALLLTTLEELTEEQLKTFQSHLTRGWMLGFPPIPESQLENIDRQDTVDHMVKRYGPERAVEITLWILREMKLNDLADKLERDHTRVSPSFSGTVTSSYRSSFQLRPKSSLSHLCGAIHPLFSSSPSFLSLGSSQKLSLSSAGSSGHLSSQEVAASEKERKPAGEEREEPSRELPSTSSGMLTWSEVKCRSRETEISSLKRNLEVLKRLSMLDVPALLLTSLKELTEEQLKTFQSHLTNGWMLGFPLIPESHLENSDRQDTVDQMVQRYGPERAVGITFCILREMKLDDLAENLQRDHTRVLLLISLEELTEDQLKTFQSKLNVGRMLGSPPIPESQLENSDRQDTVDQMVERYSPEEAVRKTLRILREINLDDLAENLERYYTRVSPSFSGTVTSSHKFFDQPRHRPIFSPMKRKYQHLSISPSFLQPGSSKELSSISGSSGQLSSQEVAASEKERKPAGEESEEPSSELPSTSSGMLTPSGEKRRRLETEISSLKKEMRFMKELCNEFTPDVLNHEGNGTYRFQCPSAGLFQCSITGLVFRMEGEGEVLYRTVHWDRRLLSQNGKRPAGPLFKFTCLKGSVCQLHLPHCQIHSGGGCDFLSVAHVTDDNMEFIPPHEITETHIIINITGFSAYGNVHEEDAPISPIQGLVLLFHQPFVPEQRSILNVFLLPSNVVRKEVREVIERDGIREILTTSPCKLTPTQEYTLSTNSADGHRIQPKEAEFVKFDSYENYYYPTFQLFLQTIVKEVDLLLKEKEGDELVWKRLVWLPASPTDVISTTPPANPSTSSSRAFIKKHRMSLETRLGLLQPLFLRLQDRGVLIGEEREEVVSKSTKTLQNQALLDMVVRKGAEAQEVFYQVLREADHFLVRDLEKKA
ncbi:uncharacterized protein ACWYII_004091 isoform 2-T2 [Salvelinus alpinus]